jgi:Ca2+-binding EF-hand superfamily protein
MRRLGILLLVLAVTPVSLGHAQEKKKAGPLVQKLLNLSPEQFLKLYDKNQDGFLSKEELPPFLQKNFEKWDRNQDGKLDQQEIGVMLKTLRQFFGEDAPPPAPAANVDVVLKKIMLQDIDGDGKISRSEAKGKVAELFDQIDTNKDNYLDREELRRFLTKALAKQPGGPGGALAPPGKGIPDFDALDANADGRLTRQELANTPFANLFDQIDTNRDGQITRQEWDSYFERQAKKEKEKGK